MKYFTSIISLAIISIAPSCTSLKRMSQQECNEIIQRLSEDRAKTAPPPKILTIDGAKRYALSNNPDVTTSLVRINQAMARLKQAQARYYPSLGISTSYNETKWQPTYGNPFAMNVSRQIYTSQISSSWLLFDGLKREFTALAMRYGKDATEQAANDVKRLLCKAVAQAFLNASLQNELVEVANADLKFKQKLLSDANDKKKTRSGLGHGDFDFLHTEERGGDIVVGGKTQREDSHRGSCRTTWNGYGEFR